MICKTNKTTSSDCFSTDNTKYNLTLFTSVTKNRKKVWLQIYLLSS